MKQLGLISAEERTKIQILAAEDMMEGMYGDVIRERIGGMIDALRVETALRRWEEAKEETREARIEGRLWERVGRVLAIEY